MDYSKLSLFAGAAERMRFLGERQSVIAQNIANANTPGYHARDLKPVDFANVLAHENTRVEMARTHPGHIAPANFPLNFKEQEKRRGYETTISDNNVVMEEEMQKMSDTSMSYQETTALYRKISDMVGLATGNR